MDKPTAIIAGLCLLILLGCSEGQKSIKLRYNFVPGRLLQYERSVRTNSKVLLPQMKANPVTSILTARIKQRVIEVHADSSADILELSSWGEQNRRSSDTSQAGTNHIREVQIRVMPSGRIVDITTDNEKDPAEMNHLRNFYEQGLPVFPKHAVTPGDSWSQTTKVIIENEQFEANMTFKVTALVREAGYDCAVIESDGTMLLPVSEQSNDSLHRSGHDRIESTGRLYFAYKEGLVVVQRERWVIDRERTGTVAGKTTVYKEAVQMDIEYLLKERSFAAQ